MVYPLFFVRTTKIPYWSPVFFIFIHNIVNCHPLLITILIYNYIRICIILSLIVANVIVYAMKPNMYSSVTKNILHHKIQFHYVFTTLEYYRVVSRNTKAWSNTPRKISCGSRNLWWVRGYTPSRGLGDAGSPLATKLNVTSRLMYSVIAD